MQVKKQNIEVVSVKLCEPLKRHNKKGYEVIAVINFGGVLIKRSGWVENIYCESKYTKTKFHQRWVEISNNTIKYYNLEETCFNRHQVLEFYVDHDDYTFDFRKECCNKGLPKVEENLAKYNNAIIKCLGKYFVKNMECCIGGHQQYINVVDCDCDNFKSWDILSDINDIFPTSLCVSADYGVISNFLGCSAEDIGMPTWSALEKDFEWSKKGFDV